MRATARTVAASTASVGRMSRASGADGVVLRFSSFVHGTNGDVHGGHICGRKTLDTTGITRHFKHQSSIVVDADGVGASDSLPFQVDSTAIVLNDARVDGAIGVDAHVGTVGSLRLASATVDGGHGDASSHLTKVSDDHTTISTGNLNHAIVIVRATSTATGDGEQAWHPHPWPCP